jgi:cell division protein FtsN
MAHDLASKRGKSRTATKKTATRKRPAPGGGTRPSVWRWYGAGVVSGVLLSFFLYLGTLAPEPRDATEAAQAESEAPPPPKPRFDFYTRLPAARIDIDVEPGQAAAARSGVEQEPAYYLLQAGSFRQLEDADRRRAELLLLGLEPTVEEANGDNGRWYRVYLGPFGSRSEMSRARSLAAAQNIDTLLLKRETP